MSDLTPEQRDTPGSTSPASVWRFADFTLDGPRQALHRGGEELRLRPQTFRVLEFLVQHADRVVTKDELFETVWAGVVVTDDSLVQCVKEMRQVLGDHDQTLIRTVPRRGYQLAVDVAREDGSRSRPAPSANPVPPRPRWRKTVIACSSAIAIAVLGFLALRPGAPPPAGRVVSLAVLPFAWLGAEGGTDEFLTLGLADAIITRLSSIDRLATRPTSAILRYRKGALDPQAAGRELGVDYVLDSRLQRLEGRLRITFQLVAVADGTTRWTDRVEAKDIGLFEAQDAIAERVASSMLERLSREDRRLLRKHDTKNPESHLAYLRGRHYWSRRTEAGLLLAVTEFQRAIALDARNAAARAGLADANNLIAAYGSAEPRSAFARAKTAALEALEIDEGSSEAHASLAFARAHADRDWPRAEEGYRRAIALAPEYSTARQWLALAHAAQGRSVAAISEAKRALDSDPLSLIINTDLGRHYYYARRYDEAIAQLRATVDLDPAFPRAHMELGRVYRQKGLAELAVAEATRAVQLSDRSAASLSELASAYAALGDRARALAIMGELEERARATHVSPYHFAVAWAGLGDVRRAMAALEAADAERFNWVVFANVEPAFDALRVDPAFAPLVERLRVAR